MAGITWTPLASDKFAGQKTLDSVVQAQLDQYKGTFAPIQRRQQVIAAGANYGEVTSDMAAAGSAAAGSIDASEAGYRRQLRNLGGQGEGEGAVRRFGLSRVLSQVDAMNKSNRSAVTRQQDAQASGLDTQVQNAQAVNSVLSDIASAETDRYSQYKSAKAQKKAATNQMIGQGVGMLAMAAMFM